MVYTLPLPQRQADELVGGLDAWMVAEDLADVLFGGGAGEAKLLEGGESVGACRGAGLGAARKRQAAGLQVVERDQAVAQFYDQPLRRPSPDSRDAGQHGGVAVQDVLAQLTRAHRREGGERQLRPDPRHAEQLLKKLSFGLGREAVEQDGILSDVKVDEKGCRFARGRERFERRGRDEHVEADAFYVDDGVGGSFFDEPTGNVVKHAGEWSVCDR